jgi:hypothetical protein
MGKIKNELISQAEFARRMGVNKSQVTRGLQRGRINLDKKTGKIDWLKAKESWGDNRVDSLASQGIANNSKQRKRKTPSIPDISDIAKIPDIPVTPDFDDINNDSSDSEKPESSDDIGKPPKRDTVAWQDYRIKKAKASQEESKEKIYRGELIPKADMVGVITTTLSAIKAGILALPSRTSLDILGIIKGAMIAKGMEFNEGDWAMFQTDIKNIMEKETHTILTDIQTKHDELDREAETIAKKYRSKK